MTTSFSLCMCTLCKIPFFSFIRLYYKIHTRISIFSGQATRAITCNLPKAWWSKNLNSASSLAKTRLSSLLLCFRLCISCCINSIWFSELKSLSFSLILSCSKPSVWLTFLDWNLCNCNGIDCTLAYRSTALYFKLHTYAPFSLLMLLIYRLSLLPLQKSSFYCISSNKEEES